jgi:hypothetical protein
LSKSKRTKTIIVNIAMFAILFGLISFNKEVLRPLWEADHFLNLLTNIFPNFIAAYVINLAIAHAILIKSPNRLHLFVAGSSILIFAIFILEEYFSLLGASTQFDVFDILASGIGVLLAFLAFELIVKKRKRS